MTPEEADTLRQAKIVAYFAYIFNSASFVIYTVFLARMKGPRQPFILLICALVLVSDIAYSLSRFTFVEALSLQYSDLGCLAECNRYYHAQAFFLALLLIVQNLYPWLFTAKYWVLACKLEDISLKKNLEGDNLFISVVFYSMLVYIVVVPIFYGWLDWAYK